jgi:hypothetical protein
MEMRINILYYFSLGLFSSAGLSFLSIGLLILSSLFSSFIVSSVYLVLFSSLSSLDPEESSLTQLLYKTVLPVEIVTTFEAVSNTFVPLEAKYIIEIKINNPPQPRSVKK